jgi:cyclin D1/2/4
LDFRPSEIAAAVAAAVAGEEHAVDIVDKACTHRVHKVHTRVSAPQATSLYVLASFVVRFNQAAS